MREDMKVAPPARLAPTQDGGDEVTPLEEAAREVVTLVKAHRVAGDGDLDAAVARIEAELAASAALVALDAQA